YRCEELPAFYSHHSGLTVDARVDTPADVVQVFAAQRSLGTESALLVTVPVPPEAEVSSEKLELSLREALAQAERAAITGRALTPFVLARLAQQSEGATLESNIALLKNNAAVAAQIALSIRNEQ